MAAATCVKGRDVAAQATTSYGRSIDRVRALTRRHIRSPALILRTTPVGEINRLVTLISPSVGVVRAMAYGAARTTSRLRLATLLFMHADLRVYRDPVKDHYKITEIACRDDFGGIRASVPRYFAASLWAEVVLRSPGAADPGGLFALLRDCLLALHACGPAAQRGLSAQFIWRYLGLAGLQPDLHGCAACDRPLAPSVAGYLSDRYGDLRCAGCSVPSDAAFSPGARAYLSHTAALAPARAAAVRLQDDGGLSAVLHRMVQRAVDAPLTALQAGAGLL